MENQQTEAMDIVENNTDEMADISLSEEIFQSLNREAEEMIKNYPQFDMAKELNNAQFSQLLLAGMDIKSSYEFCHAEEIRQNEIKKALEEAKEQWLNNMIANAQRPGESASQGINESAEKTPDNMSRAERESIAKRAAHGEIIRF